MDPWGERLLASAIGASAVGVVVALAGIGPERVLTGLVAIAAASLLGALLDDLLETASSGRVVAPQSVPPAVPPVAEPRRAPTPPRIGTERTASHARPPEPAPAPTPGPRWEEPRRPEVDEPSGRWAASTGRDLVAIHRTATGPADALCTHCGRSVTATRGDRPTDCPAPGGTVPCTLTARADVLWTDFRALRRVSPGEGSDLV